MSSRNALPFATTIHVRDICLCLHLQRAARVVARRFDEELRPHGLTNGQFSLLMSLNRPEPATLASVSAVLGMDRTTVTANVKPLVRRGLVTVSRNPADKRGRRLTLTTAGRVRLAAALPTWKRTHAEIECDLPSANAEGLRADLRALCAGSTGA